MRLKTIYQLAIAQGIKNDPRGERRIKELLAGVQKSYGELPESEKKYFDQEQLINPFNDTRIIFGNPVAEIRHILVGVDIQGVELLLARTLIQQGEKIDLVLSHHPEGKAFVNFYDVINLQTDLFQKQGISMAIAEDLVHQRLSEVERKTIAANHNRTYDIARALNINMLSVHTPCDNMAFTYVTELFEKKKPKTLERIIELLLLVPEYEDAAKGGRPPMILNGQKSSRTEKIYVDFTGGTEGPAAIYPKLTERGIDTIVGMHFSEEHYQAAKASGLHLIVAGHIASDNLGINIFLDELHKHEKISTLECSGFRRFTHKQNKTK